MPNSHDERSSTLRSPLLNRLTMVTLLTIVVAIGYLVSYYVRGAMLHHTTWYHASRLCSPTESRCQVTLGQVGTLEVHIDHGEDHRLNLQVSAGDMPVTHMLALLERRETSSEPRKITLQKTEDGDYRAENVVLPCAAPEARWRLSIIVKAPERSVGTWYDIDDSCQLTTVALHLPIKAVHS